MSKEKSDSSGAKMDMFVRQRAGGIMTGLDVAALSGGGVFPSDEDAAWHACEGQALFSRDGAWLAVVQDGHVAVHDAATMALAVRVPEEGVLAMQFSPLGSFLVTWRRPLSKKQREEREERGNLAVWRLSVDGGDEATEQARFFQQQYEAEQWPTVQWTEDEELCGRAVNNEVHFYDGHDPAGPETGIVRKLVLPGVRAFQLAPMQTDEEGNTTYRFASYCPATKNRPASVLTWEYPRLSRGEHTANKSFNKADSVLLKWNSRATHLLIHTTTDVDASNRSYYGESGLYLLQFDGQLSCNVSLNSSGPLLDAQWGPKGKEFIVIEGHQPAQATLFLAEKCTPFFEFGAASRNTIRWSPHGRFVMMGGFGNLSGDMEFWDVYKRKQIATCQDINSAKTFEWAPDSRKFITATLHPWRRVDNGFKVWSYAGELLHHELIEELYQVLPRPVPEGTFEDLPQSPRLRKKGSKKGHKHAAPKPKPKARYVPPSLRGKTGNAPATGRGTSLAERLGEVRGAGPRLIGKKEGKKKTWRDAEVVGAVPAGVDPAAEAKRKKNRERNKRRRSRKKKQEEEEQEQQEKEQEKEQKKEEQEQPPKEDPEDVRVKKRLRAVNKKLRQIEAIKLKPAEDLQEGQKTKLAKEGELLAKRAELEQRLAELTG